MSQYWLVPSVLAFIIDANTGRTLMSSWLEFGLVILILLTGIIYGLDIRNIKTKRTGGKK